VTCSIFFNQDDFLTWGILEGCSAGSHVTTTVTVAGCAANTAYSGSEVRSTGPSTCCACAAGATFANVKQQLPAVPSIDAFLASHQTGIAQLAIAYCSAMVDSDPLRTAFFGSLNPNQPGSVFAGAGNQANRNTVVDALNTKAVGDLTSQPTASEIFNEVDDLLQKIAAGTSGTNPKGAGVAMKGACAAVLGSAALTVQ